MNDIRIPLINDESSSEIHFYADELPEDPNVLIDVLRDVLAPLKVWRTCAVEYHRQGMDEQFNLILHEIVNALLNNQVIEDLYKQRGDYTEGITEVYVSLAAKALSDLTRARRAQLEDGKYEGKEQEQQEALSQYSKQVVELLKSADDLMRINEYTWLIKGFFEIIQGDSQRAESQFRAVYERAAKGQSVLKKKFLFASLVGLGIVAYGGGHYSQALEHFTAAVQANPSASAVTVRLAVGCCCFKLEQYDRAKLALEKCFSLEPANCNLLVLMSLVELAMAKRDRMQRQQCRRRALEYSVLAQVVNPSSAAALNLIANHHFHSWTHVHFSDGCYILDSAHLLVPAAAAEDAFEAGNQLKVNRDDAICYSIAAASDRTTDLSADATATLFRLLPAGDDALSEHGFLVLTIDPTLPPSKLPSPVAVSADSSASQRPLYKVDDLEIRQLVLVEQLAVRALECSSLPIVRAESYYILGKVAHAKRDVDAALEFYFKALKDHEEMALAAFGAAQIFFCKREFQPALELFDRVLKRQPDDKDTQAYVILLRTLLRSEKANFEKLKEVAPGFQFEVDLWLSQAQLRQQSPMEHKEALRCYMSARDCVLQRLARGELDVKPLAAEVLSNISILNHSLGALDVALEFSKHTLLVFKSEQQGSPNSSASEVEMQPVFTDAALEGLFYDWSEEAICSLQRGAGTDQFVLHVAAADDARGISGVDLRNLLTEGDEVLIAGIKHRVVRVDSATEVVCRSPVRLDRMLSQQPADSDATVSDNAYTLHVKVPFNNFTDSTVVYSYNLARLLEDEGSSAAAGEIYVELLKRHPSFTECYLRLSLMASSIGRFDEASMWVTRALAVNPADLESMLYLGDLFAQSNQPEDAKRCYERNCSQDKHDARSLLSLGNFYFWISMTGGSNEALASKGLKESYKFFYNVLKDNPHNAYGANGLAMVCVQKGEIETAREILVKAREAQMPISEHIDTNLAHVNVMQHRPLDAERLYQGTCRGLMAQSGAASCHSGGRSVADKAAYLHECIGYAQYRLGASRFDSSVRSLLRSLHLNPINMRVWYNVAVVGKSVAAGTVNRSKGQKGSSGQANASVEDIVEAQLFTQLAQKVFQQLAAIQFGKRAAPYDKQLATSNATACAGLLNSLEERYHEASEELAEEAAARSRIEEEHNVRIMTRKLEEERAAHEAAVAHEEKQKLIAAKAQKLEELQEKWTAGQSSGGVGTDATTNAAAGEQGQREGGAAASKRSRKRSRGRKNRVDSDDGMGDDSDDDSRREKGLSGANEDDEDDRLVQVAMGSTSLSQPSQSTAEPRKGGRLKDKPGNSGDGSDEEEEEFLAEEKGSYSDRHGAIAGDSTGDGSSPRKRLRGSVIADEDNDDDSLFGAGAGGDEGITSNIQRKQQQRTITDDDEEL